MEFFQKLGAIVESRWRDRNHDEQAFPSIALAALAELPPSENVDALEIAAWAQDAANLPRQVGDGTFGEPPLTVYAGTHFYIEVLYWLEGTTAIHQHPFSGAFHVLRGSSIHARYGFEIERRVNTACLFGPVALQEVEYLGTGASRPIVPGRDFIHSLFHLDHPSVSVVVRTYYDWEYGPQYLYRKPCLATAMLPAAGPLRRQLAALDVLRQVQDPGYERALARFLAAADLHDAYRALDDAFSKTEDWGKFCSLVEHVGARHGEVWRDLLDVFGELRRQGGIVARRRLAHSAEHRFFLALLLNVPRRGPLLSMVQARFPERPPIETVLRWISEMSHLTTEDPGGTDALGLALDDGSLSILGGLLHGLEGPALKARLLEEYEQGDVEALTAEIDDLSRAFRSADLLRPLFTE